MGNRKVAQNMKITEAVSKKLHQISKTEARSVSALMNAELKRIVNDESVEIQIKPELIETSLTIDRELEPGIEELAKRMGVPKAQIMRMAADNIARRAEAMIESAEHTKQ